jgi:hypothetical protein
MQQIVANYVTQSLHSRCTVENVFHIGGFREKICPDDMPKLSPSSVALLDGAIVLSRRDGTARWQARFKNGSRWIRVTTKAKDLNDAKEVARELYTDARYRVKHGTPASPSDLRMLRSSPLIAWKKRWQRAKDGASIATMFKP